MVSESSAVQSLEAATASDSTAMLAMCRPDLYVRRHALHEEVDPTAPAGSWAGIP